MRPQEAGSRGMVKAQSRPVRRASAQHPQAGVGGWGLTEVEQVHSCQGKLAGCPFLEVTHINLGWQSPFSSRLLLQDNTNLPGSPVFQLQILLGVLEVP